MKNNHFKISILLFSLIVFSKILLGQYRSQKYCPNTPAWNNNRPLVENEQGMYETHAKGPDGCWWIKDAKFISYKEGYYQFDLRGTKYYYNKRKKYWENANRTVCVVCPFGQ